MEKISIPELKRFGEYCWGKWGSWAYDEWKQHNKTYFEGKLEPGAIIWDLLPHGGSIGLYHPGKSIIKLHAAITGDVREVGYSGNSAKVNPWGIEHACLGERYASDVLLHEMIHAAVYYIHDSWGSGRSSHNNSVWVAEVNRIAPLLGLKVKASVVRQSGKKETRGKWLSKPGCLSQSELSRFPHSVRGKKYYERRIRNT